FDELTYSRINQLGEGDVTVTVNVDRNVKYMEVIPRNDKNYIYPELIYALCFWEGDWKSTEIKISEGNTLNYDYMPRNTVYWVKCFSEGKEERPFIYVNDSLVWL
ncbi:MAG: hypothetical protein R3Y26_10610, partial [Rikenellaceae bacterium]